MMEELRGLVEFLNNKPNGLLEIDMWRKKLPC